MAFGGVAGWNQILSDRSSLGAIVALLGALLLGLPSLLCAQVDPPPTGDDLLVIPTPGDGGPIGGDNPFNLVPTLPQNVQITGDYSIEWDSVSEIIVYEGDVQARADNGLQLFANKVVVDSKKKFIRFQGDVSVYQGAILHRGENAIYHFEEKRLEADGLRTGMDPILLEAGQFRMVEKNGRRYFIGENAGVTTDDSENPSFWVRAERTTVIPDERVIFRSMKFYLGDRPIFWLPYLSQPLDKELGYHIVPGARSTWGPYLLNRYGIMLGGEKDPETGERRESWILSQWHLDLLAKRGVGTGVDLFDTRLKENSNLGWLKLYYIADQSPTDNRIGVTRHDVSDHRFRAQLRHRLQLKDLIAGGDSWLDADLTYLSDRFYLEDYDPGTFRLEPNPDNILSFTHQRNRNLITLWGRLRTNSFYQSDTRLPEIALDQVRHPLFGTAILHEGQAILGIYNEHLSDFQRRDLKAEAAAWPLGDPRIAEINTILGKHGYTRLHLWQEVSLPLALNGWLNLVPRAGLGYTSYRSVDGLSGNDERKHIFAGIDASIKFSREYPEVHSESLGLDGLLHVVQPYANASWLATNELDSSFPRIDRLTASTRPRPLGVGRFSPIDDLEDWSIIRLGARNRFLTRRDGHTHEWLTVDSYFDWFLTDPEFDRKFSNFYNDIFFHPLPWLKLGLETQLPLLGKEGDFTEVAATLRYMPTESLEISLRHRYLNNHPILQNSIRLEYEAYQRFNDDWGAGFSHRWEFDDGVLEHQQYSLHRTLDNWAISLGLFHRDNRDKDEFGFVLGFTLRDFPNVNLPLKVDAE